jgi:hypothetical protein
MNPRLMGALYPSSRVRVGFVFNWSPTLGYDPSDREAQLVSEIQAVMINYLNDDVVLSNVRVTVNPVPGYFSSGYITVEATTDTELPSANSVADMIEYGLRTYLLTIQIIRRDEALIDYVAPAARNQPGVQQAGPPTVCDWNTMDFRDYIDCQLGIGKFSKSQTPTTTVQGQPRTPQPPLAPGECDFSRQSFGDWLSCSLGLKSVTGGAAAGASLGLVLVGGVVLLALVASRR